MSIKKYDLELLEINTLEGIEIDTGLLSDIKLTLDELSEIYYNGDDTEESPYSDQDFDRLMEIYNKNSKESYSTLTAPRSTGKKLTNFENKFPHMASTMDKTYSIEDVTEWLSDKCEKADIENDDKFTLLVTKKFDGNSVILEFNHLGKLESAVTRGKDGKGVNLTEFFNDRVIPIDDLKKKYDINEDTKIGIKCEAIITFEDFKSLNEENNNVYKVPRNTVSGILNRNDNTYYRKFVSLAPIDMDFVNSDSNPDKLDKMHFFKKVLSKELSFKSYEFYGDNVDNSGMSNYGTFEDNIKYLTELYTKHIEFRDLLKYQIDGLVIEFIDPKYIDILGRTNDRNKFDVALKFPELIAHTEVEDIEFYMSNKGTGRITPVVKFKDLNFNGAIAHHVSIANYRRFNELKLGVGSKVIIEYRGDVMSYLLKDPNDKVSRKPIPFPTKCPMCNEDLKPNKTNVFMACVNESCDANIAGKLTNWFIKQDIKGVKDNTIKKLVEAGKIKHIPDLYKLTKEDIMTVPGFKETSAKNLYEAIHSKEVMYDYQLFGSLLFTSFGLRKNKELFKVYTMDDLIDFDNECLVLNIKDKLLAVPGIADSMVNSFINGFNVNLETIKFFLENYTVLDYKSTIKEPTGETYNIVFTGFRDKDLQSKLEDLGHKVASSTSKKTDFVVTKDPSKKSSKLIKAEELGIPIMTPDEFKSKFDL